MFGLGNPGTDLATKINESKNFNDWEKAILIQGLKHTEDCTDTTVLTLRKQACDNCANNPKNGGSGICHCTLGLPVIN